MVEYGKCWETNPAGANLSEQLGIVWVVKNEVLRDTIQIEIIFEKNYAWVPNNTEQRAILSFICSANICLLLNLSHLVSQVWIQFQQKSLRFLCRSDPVQTGLWKCSKEKQCRFKCVYHERTFQKQSFEQSDVSSGPGHLELNSSTTVPYELRGLG